MSIRLTEQDQELLRCLSLSVRYLTRDQIHRGFWPDALPESSSVVRRLGQLVAENWLGRKRVIVRPIPRLLAPIRHWKPGDPRPAHGKDSWQAKSRWVLPPASQTVYFVGRKAAHAFLGTIPRGIRQYFQVTHDLGVAETFIHFRRFRRDESTKWCGEIELPPGKKRRKKPDAVIADGAIWPPRLVVEFAGSYSKTRIIDFHNFCEAEGIPYELW